ncbi:MAG: OB-fold nucleic acid binding domain-containing protein [Thermoproteota archaeon]|nr:OB-fold nucleic acid binding domain-containing protein [Thermoproteota archaeon]
MNSEKIVQRILSSRPDLSHEEVLEKIKEKKTKAGGYFTDDAAARIVASELGVEIPEKKPKLLELSVKDLISGLNDITVTGRVVAVYPLRSFTRSDGTKGQIARLLIADKTGMVKVTLWNDKAAVVKTEKVKPGQIIRVSHGYVRKGWSGKLELHMRRRGEIRIGPSDVTEDNYPQVTDFLQKIGAIKEKGVKAHFVGVVRYTSPVYTFQRRDGTNGKVRRILLEDETGLITAAVWNEKVDQLEKLKKNDCLQVINSKVKEGRNGKLESHINSATAVEILAEKPKTLSSLVHLKKISKLKEGDGPINVEGKIVTEPIIREVTTARKEKVQVASFELTDESGKIWVSVWRELAEIARKLTTGTRIQIQNGFVKKGFAEQLEITSHDRTSIRILTKTEG